MGLSDDPLPTLMQARQQVAVSQEDLRREFQGYHFRAMSDTAYVMSIFAGALLGKLMGVWVELHWQRVFVVLGAVGFPAFLWWTSKRRAKRYAQLDAVAQYRRQAADRERRDRQIEEARARGDFDRWKKDE